MVDRAPGRVSVSARYVFRSEWQLAASADAVYAALLDVAGYPTWWPQVRSVRQFDDETGEVRCRSLLPYDLVFAIRRVVEDPAARVLRAHQTGDLEGWSQWSISAAAGGAIVVFDEDVVVRKPLVRRAGLLARPALRFNHAVMMRDGERGLRRHLEQGA
jgi:hypothetical protein